MTGIVEDALATPEQKRIRELNCGVYCFRADWLWPSLAKLRKSPKGEYFLTDLLEMAVSEGQRVEAVTTEDAEQMLGINDRTHLARAEAIARRVRTRCRLAVWAALALLFFICALPVLAIVWRALQAGWATWAGLFDAEVRAALHRPSAAPGHEQ